MPLRVFQILQYTLKVSYYTKKKIFLNYNKKTKIIIHGLNI